MGRWSERRGDYVRLKREPGDEAKRPRIGTPHVLGLSKADFTDVLSIKAEVIEHSSVLEMQALVMSVQLALRSAERQNTQLVVLVDAKAVSGAVAKGRSSSPALLFHLRKLSALLFASGRWFMSPARIMLRTVRRGASSVARSCEDRP